MSDSDTESVSSAGSIIEDISEPDVTSFKCLFCDEQTSPIDKLFSHVEVDHKFAIRDAIKEIGSSISYRLPRTDPPAIH
jgi:protein arginine N-methyltransferase 3